jgi:hypothetical protein
MKKFLTIWLCVTLSLIAYGHLTGALGACYSWKCDETTATTSTPTRTYITNTHRQKVGDLYSVPGQRTQIRDNHRRILGYIETDGTITNTNRQKIGETND